MKLPTTLPRLPPPSTGMENRVTSHELSTGWSFKEAGDPEDAWLPVARVPTNVHLDLIACKRIPDPFVGFNELECRWVAERAWMYRITLPAAECRGSWRNAALVFEGLDTFATVMLNGETVLESDNMFVPHRVDVTSRLRKHGPNELSIVFHSALLRAKEIKQAYPNHKWIAFNGDTSRLAVRKAQYHWGWDWGPELNTCGPWRPVRFETYEVARIDDLRIEYDLDMSLSSVTGTIHVHVDGVTDGVVVKLGAKHEGNDVFKAPAYIDSSGAAKVKFSVNNPKLWYPRGYGAQNLYEIEARLDFDEGDHNITKKVGFRRVELIQEKDEHGKSFYFRINNVDIFCGGSNWIPADSFTPRTSNQNYRRWLQTMVDGNQVMARVWGGGIWEENIFYDTCDELGIMVWQDFMFACGNYPAFPSFLKSVREEGIANIRRLRHHPCLVLFAGNNEDYQVREQSGLQYNYEDKDPQSWLKTDFPARYIYEKLLPEIVKEESPSIPYHPGSPWGDGKNTSDPSVGDMHQWNVWHGTQEKYQIYGDIGGRFNSEFGMEAFPNIDTVRSFGASENETYTQSKLLDFHNKASGHERRIATYLAENFRLDQGITIYLTQLCQAEALSYAYRGWRRQWGQGRRCGGALVWQLNDCWPVTSWSIIDYYISPKPAYYAISRALSPITIGVQREHRDWTVESTLTAKRSAYWVWIASSLANPVKATIELRFISIRTGKDIKNRILVEDAITLPNSTTEILHDHVDDIHEEHHVLAARLWVNGDLVARDADWPQPFKYLSFEDRGVEVNFEKDCIRLKAQKPVKGLVFEEQRSTYLTDNAVDLMPGDEQIIQIRATTGRSPNQNSRQWTYYGRE